MAKYGEHASSKVKSSEISTGRVTKRVDAVGEGEERSVDVGAVAKLVPAVVGLRRALRARQVHERELTGGERLAVVVPFRASDCTGWWWRGHRSVLFRW